MNKNIQANLIKLLLNSADFLGRSYLYNREIPPIGKFYNDIPYGEHPSQKVDLLLPKHSSSKAGIVYVHGGGWLMGNKASYHRVCATWTAAGYPVVNVNYRLGPEFTYHDQLSDINQAVRLAFDLFPKHGCLSNKLVLAGDSAGAHLTSWYAAATQKPELADWVGLKDILPAEIIQALVLIYGAYDLETTRISGFPFVKTFYHAFLGKTPTPQEVYHLSPLHHIQENFPRTFVFGLESDALINESMRLIKEFEKQNIPYQPMVFTHAEYPNARHGFINHYTMSFAQHAMREIIKFLNSLPVKEL